MIKTWRDEMLEKEGEESASCLNDLEALDILIENRDLNEEEEWVRFESKKRLEEIEAHKAKDLRQRSRSRWDLDGDENSRFFHGIVNGRKASNGIHGILVNEMWESRPKKIKKNVYDFFRMKFKEDWVIRPELSGFSGKKLSDLDAASLVSPFSSEEIKAAVFECGDDRAPGPDGFNFRFIKRFWNLLEADFFNLFQVFFDTGVINRGCSSSFIVLVPKVKDPISMNDYRPINLVGVINKAISKVLANRLKLVIGTVISNTQTAFIKDRMIVDGPLILNELISWAKKKKKKMCVYKIDFAKAYDNVNWNFLISIMSKMGFPKVWGDWIFGILSSARSSVLVKGAPTFEFKCEKGMRQGDPISPFLFLIVMEAFSWMVNRAVESGGFHGISLPNSGPCISHLLYADDCILIGEWSKVNVESIGRLLRCFYLCSGLRINLNKSSVFGIEVDPGEVSSMAGIAKCQVGSLPFNHLGILVGANMNKISNWNFLFDIFQARLASWKGKCLSIGGRVTLIKAVLESLPTYYFSIFKAPSKVLDGLESIMRRFLWGGTSEEKKINWVSWDRVTSPIKVGGLGLVKLRDANVAMLSKWLWRFKNEPHSLWRSVITGIHDSNRNWASLPSSSSLTSSWKNIVRSIEKVKVSGVDLKHLIKGEVGNGLSIRFWLDPWLCNMPLKEKFPNLFKLEKSKRCKVRDRYNQETASFSDMWSWSRIVLNGAEVREWSELNSLLSSVYCSNRRDGWSWLGGHDKVFSVKEVKAFLSSDRDFSIRYVFKWSKWIPKKCNIFLWRAEMNRIPTMLALKDRKCNFGDVLCGLCKEETETVDHLFGACEKALKVWQNIGVWCKVRPIFAFCFKDLLEIHNHSGLGKRARKIFKGIVAVTCWNIWKARNDYKFSNVEIDVGKITVLIKANSYRWYNSRAKNDKIS